MKGNMVIRYEVFDRQVERAREKLIAKGIIARDGSGDSDVEELFTFLSLFRDGKMILTGKKETYL